MYSFTIFLGYCEYRRRLFEELRALETFRVEPMVQRGWEVRPFVPPSPVAARHGFLAQPDTKQRLFKLSGETETSNDLDRPSEDPLEEPLVEPVVEPVIEPLVEPLDSPLVVPRTVAPKATFAPPVESVDIDLTLTSSEDEDEAPNVYNMNQAAKAEVKARPVRQVPKIVERIRETIRSLPPTPLYNRLQSQKDHLVRSWIRREERMRERAEGYFVPDSEALPSLHPEAVGLVQEVWMAGCGGEAVVEAGDIPLTVSDLRRLRGKTWLNDECINGYLQLVQGRDPDRIHAFNTFFHTTLSKRGYEGVQRWSRRFNIFAKELILIPVHLGMHWTMSCIDMARREIIYLDSFHAGNQSCLRNLWAYLQAEHQDKLGQPWDSTGWKAYAMTQGVPEQRNGYDCGVFTCVFAEHLARRSPLDFSQADMPYFRTRIAYELLSKTLLSPP